jgi:hypothetical protein
MATFRGPPKPMTNFIIGVPGPPGPAGPAGPASSPQAVQVPFGAASASSVDTVPSGSLITAVGILVTTAFTGGSNPVATITVGGVSVLPISGNPNPADLTHVGTYFEFQISTTSTTSVVTVTFSGTATAGAAVAIVLFNASILA